MVPTIRSLLLGAERPGGRVPALLLAAGTFVVSFAAYALGVFTVPGGVVWIPFPAAVVGTVAACWVGYDRRGLAFGWLVTCTSLLGFHADHALFGLSSRSPGERLAYVVRPDGLAFLGVEGVVLGTLAFAVGSLLHWGVDSVRTGTTQPGDGG